MKKKTGAFKRMNKGHHSGKHYSWFRKEHSTRALILFLIFVPPIGIYLMWTQECHWETWIKAAVSGGIALVLALLLILLPELPNAELEGNVEIKYRKLDEKRFAPFKPEGVPDTVQVVKQPGETSSLISTPTATPDPVMVYCNDNGLYYHLQDCRYVYETTPRVTLMAAIKAGKTACSICKPPDEVVY